MKKYILIAFFTSLTFSQFETDEEPSDSTFIIIKSGDSIRINKFEADLRFQPMLKLELNEVAVLLQLVESSQFAGKDAELIYELLNKLKKEAKKLMPKRTKSLLVKII